MKFIFIDKDESEKDIILHILQSYGVKYKINKSILTNPYYYSYIYNIEIDVTYEFYTFLNKEIENKLEIFHNDCILRQQLEANFRAPSYNKVAEENKSESSQDLLKGFQVEFKDIKYSPAMTILQFINKVSQEEEQKENRDEKLPRDRRRNKKSC